MTADTDTTDVLLSILEEDLEVKRERVSADTYLIADLGLDSLALMMALTAIEERLGVTLAEEELLRCATFGDLERTVSEARGSGTVHA
jgi:acyl carrier protein